MREHAVKNSGMSAHPEHRHKHCMLPLTAIEQWGTECVAAYIQAQHLDEQIRDDAGLPALAHFSLHEGVQLPVRRDTLFLLRPLQLLQLLCSQTGSSGLMPQSLILRSHVTESDVQDSLTQSNTQSQTLHRGISPV